MQSALIWVFYANPSFDIKIRESFFVHGDYDRRFLIFNISLSLVGFCPCLRKSTAKETRGAAFENQLLDIHMARFTIHMVTPGTRRGNKSASKIWIIRLTSSTPRDTLTLGLILLIAAESTGTDEEKKHFSILVQCLSQIGYIHIMHSGIHSCNCDHRSHCICNCRHHHCHRHYLRHHHNQDDQMIAASGSGQSCDFAETLF